MSSKTKIIVLHMREIIYTVVFAVLALILIFSFLYVRTKKGRKKDFRPDIYAGNLFFFPHFK